MPSYSKRQDYDSMFQIPREHTREPNLCPPGSGNEIRDQWSQQYQKCQHESDGCRNKELSKCLEGSLPSQVTLQRQAKQACSSTPTARSIVNALANPCTPTNSSAGEFKISKKQPRRTALSTSVVVTTPTSSSSETSIGSSDTENDVPVRPRPRHNRNLNKDFTRPTSSPGRPSQISVAMPPTSCDLIVAVGNQEFYYSSSILATSSDYLQSPAVKRNPDNRFYVCFPSQAPNEWLRVVKFLQSGPTGSEQLTWQSFPTVLPWFSELRLKDLLRDADLFLLETIVVSQSDDRSENVAITLQNLLILSDIGFSCSLELTKSQARQWLQAKLIHPQDSDLDEDGDDTNEDDVELEWSLQDLQALSQILTKHKDLRDYLWDSSIIMYLPHDLSVDDSEILVSNPLFPYLLREGMVQLSIVQRAQRVIEQQRKRTTGSISPTLTSSSETTIPTNHLATVKKQRLTQNLLNVLLQTTQENLVTFQRNKVQRPKSVDSPHDKWKRQQQPRNQFQVVYSEDDLDLHGDSSMWETPNNNDRTFAC